MSDLLRNLARSRFTKSEFSHSSGKGMLLGEMVTSTTPDENKELFDVFKPVTEKPPVVNTMDMEALNNAGFDPGSSYKVGNISDRGTDVMIGWFNDTTNRTFSDSTEANFNFSDFLDCDIFNESCLMSNSSNFTVTESGPPGPETYAYWSLLLLVFPLLTVFGNILVVLSIYRERTLRHVTNYFICSLAIADIMVAVVVMPPAVYLEVSNISICNVEIVLYEKKIL